MSDQPLDHHVRLHVEPVRNLLLVLLHEAVADDLNRPRVPGLPLVLQDRLMPGPATRYEGAVSF